MKLSKIKIDPNKMDHIEIGADSTGRPLLIIGIVIYILVSIFVVNNLINYFN